MAKTLGVALPRRDTRRIDLSRAVPVLVLMLGALAYWFIYAYYRTDTPVHSDGEGYYAYLPAWIGNFDPSFRTVVMRHMLPAYPRLGIHAAHDFGMSLQPNGSWLDKYGVGTAILLVPFFVAGHIVALISGDVANGYSGPERFITGIGALAYTVLGVVALRHVLRRWFSDGVVAVTLLAIVFGTGLVSYFTFDPTFSHAFSFFAVAIVLLTALRWYEQPQSWWRAAALGAAMGLVVAIRLTDAEVLIAVPFLGIAPRLLPERLAMLWRQRLRVLLGIGCAMLVFLPQVVTWYIATGHLIVRSYPGEYFDFAHPHLVETLVWLQPHGLLPYAPVLAFSLAGLAWCWWRRRDIALPVTLAFLGFWYLVASWWAWSYSSSYGDRAFLDVLPLLALPMAALFAAARQLWVRVPIAILAAACVVVTCMLTVAWWQNRMPGDGANAAQYANILLHPRALLGPPR